MNKIKLLSCTITNIPFIRIWPTLAIFILLFSGCVEEIEDRPPDLGPEVKSTKIDSSLMSALKGVHPYTVALEDFQLYELNARIENAAPVKLKDIRSTVIGRLDEETSFDITILREETTYLDTGETEVIETEIHDSFSKALPEGLYQSASTTYNKDLLFKVSGLFANNNVIKVTYHNLRIEKTQMSPPMKTLPPNCIPPESCLINVTHIDYDVALWPESGESPEVISFETSLSAETHFYAVEIYNCISQTIKDETRSFLLRRCLVLRDYTPQVIASDNR